MAPADGRRVVRSLVRDYWKGPLEVTVLSALLPTRTPGKNNEAQMRSLFSRINRLNRVAVA